MIPGALMGNGTWCEVIHMEGTEPTMVLQAERSKRWNENMTQDLRNVTKIETESPSE